MSVKEQLLALMKEYTAIQSENIRLKSTNEKLKKAILDYGKNPAGFDWAVLDKIDTLETENERLKDGLISIRKSTEIMEARRFAEEALKDTNGKEEVQKKTVQEVAGQSL